MMVVVAPLLNPVIALFLIIYCIPIGPEVVLPEGTSRYPCPFRRMAVAGVSNWEQAPNFPTDSHPAAAIEGCGTGNNGLHAIAFRNACRRFDDGMLEVSPFWPPTQLVCPTE